MIKDTMPTPFHSYIIPEYVNDGTGGKILRINPLDVANGYNLLGIEIAIKNYLTANASDLASLSPREARMVAIRNLTAAQRAYLHFYEMATLSTIPLYVEICRKHRKNYVPSGPSPLKPGQYIVQSLFCDNIDNIVHSLDKVGNIPSPIWILKGATKKELAQKFAKTEDPYPWTGDHGYIGKDGDSAHTSIIGSSPTSLSEIHISVSDAIERNVSYLTLLQMFAHEFYGHAYLYLFPHSDYYGMHLEGDEGREIERTDKNTHFMALASLHQKLIYHYETKKINSLYVIPPYFQT